jgi:putative molybdopterin biosynthesis protein
VEDRPLRRILRDALPFPCTVVGFAVWEQGIMLAPGNPLGVGAVEDLARPELRLLNREEGSGSRAVLDRALARAGVEESAIPGYRGTAAAGHWAVAQGVAAGSADAGVGIRAAARAFGLAWVPLEEERYDLVIPDALLGDPAVEALLDLLRFPALQAQVESLGGYDIAPMGLPG